MSLTLIEPLLYQRAEEIAREQQTNIADILNRALRHYLWEMDRRKIAVESNAYRQQHAQLCQNYLGQYIALHNGKVVDHDADFTLLRARVRQRWPDTAVMITLVTEESQPTLERSGNHPGPGYA